MQAAATWVPKRPTTARQVWIRGTLAAAGAMTAIDAALLQQKKSFFTGGFLTAVHTTSVGEALAFFTTSLVIDAAVAGTMALLLLLLTVRVRLMPMARLWLVTIGSMAPMLTWDFVTYRLLAYLGDAFDLELMFDLAGRNPGELVAVSSAHLLAAAVLVAAGTAVVAGTVWVLNRSGGPAMRAHMSVPRSLAIAGAWLFATGLVTSAAASSASDVVEDGLRRKASGNLFTRLTAALTDVDRDGFGIAGRIRDPAPLDGGVYPYALDVPGNGIDENAVGGDLPAGAPPYLEPPAPRGWRHRPDVVLFVLESFRADAVGRMVKGRAVTPVLDVLAREGVASSRAFSHNGYTTQSRFHLLTGSLPGGQDGSLIDDFNANGYQTAYFSAQDESFGDPALAAGFARAEVAYDARQDRARRYSTFTTAGSLAVSHAVLRERIEAFLLSRANDRPLFLYVNFHDTHFPYHHAELDGLLSGNPLRQADIAPGRADAVRDMYYNAAANVDRAVGLTLDLVRRAVGRDPAVIVTADHGESLFDLGFLGHGYALNDAQTRIPLIVRGLPMEIAEPFGQADLRGAIAAALSRDEADATRRPRTFQESGKAVFQYLGAIHRPRQIGFATGSDRLIYDFRERLVLDAGGVSRIGAGRDLPLEALRLVHLWERMMLARANHETADGSSPPPGPAR